jgi:hypothetical protein
MFTHSLTDSPWQAYLFSRNRYSGQFMLSGFYFCYQRLRLMRNSAHTHSSEMKWPQIHKLFDSHTNSVKWSKDDAIRAQSQILLGYVCSVWHPLQAGYYTIIVCFLFVHALPVRWMSENCLLQYTMHHSFCSIELAFERYITYTHMYIPTYIIKNLNDSNFNHIMWQ